MVFSYTKNNKEVSEIKTIPRNSLNNPFRSVYVLVDVVYNFWKLPIMEVETHSLTNEYPKAKNEVIAMNAAKRWQDITHAIPTLSAAFDDIIKKTPWKTGTQIAEELQKRFEKELKELGDIKLTPQQMMRVLIAHHKRFSHATTEPVFITPEPTIEGDLEAGIVFGSCHHPYFDWEVFRRLVIPFLKTGLNPIPIVRIDLTGDLIDFFRISDPVEFPKDPLRSLDGRDKERIRKELAATLAKELVAQELDADTERNEGIYHLSRPRKKQKKTIQLDPKDCERLYLAANIEKEINLLGKMFKELREICPDVIINWLFGEHELKLKQYLVRQFPRLYQTLLHVASSHRVIIIDSNTPQNEVRYGNLTIAHIRKGRKGEAITSTILHGLLDKHQSSFVVGHTMQGGSAYKTYIDKRVEGAYNNFGMALLTVNERQSFPNRQQGLNVVLKRRKGDSFRVFEIPIVKGGFFWGNTEYRLTQRQSKWERILVYGDPQFYYHDPVAIQLVMALIKREQPEHIVLNGDLIDFPEISRFVKKPFFRIPAEKLKEMYRKHRELESKGVAPRYYELDPGIQSAMEVARDHLKAVRQLAPKAKISLTFGNHEWRFYSKLLTEIPQIYGLREPDGEYSFDLGRLLGAKELDIHVEEGDPTEARIENYLYFGEALAIGHYYTSRGKSSYTARALVDRLGVSIVEAHVQRGGTYYKTKPNGDVLEGCEGFCVASIEKQDVTYDISPNFQHGCVMIHKRVDGNRFYIQPLLIYRGTLFYGKDVYRVKM